ncbi:phosphotransferase [Micromonospora rubida]|uniref:Phosphotransferase n=1 Tax=Micromonospora rubida TaxID=2697657 RepID=A0ABW7ST19_9ACTN
MINLRTPGVSGDVGTIDHGWLRRNLGWPVTGDEPITTRSISPSGGVMGSVHRVGCGGRSFVLKGPPDDTTAWGRHAAAGRVVQREIELYRYLRARGPAAPKVAPDCYWSMAGADGGRALALEDLGPCDTAAADMAAGLDLDQATAAVRCLAQVHADSATAEADALVTPYPWLYTAESDELVKAVRVGLEEDLPRMVSQHWPGAAVRHIADIDVAGVLLDVHRGARLTALCHGDAWSANVILRERPEPGGGVAAYLIDWQYAMWGNPLSDVALLLWSSVQPRHRRSWQDDLLRTYRATLTATVGTDYSIEDCQHDFARAEPQAVLVVLATLEAYATGMSAAELSHLEPRVLAALDYVTRLPRVQRGF